MIDSGRLSRKTSAKISKILAFKIFLAACPQTHQRARAFDARRFCLVQYVKSLTRALRKQIVYIWVDGDFLCLCRSEKKYLENFAAIYDFLLMLTEDSNTWLPLL